MAPAERTAKRQKLSPPADARLLASTGASQPTPSPASSTSLPSQDGSINRSSWYSRTWPRKAKAAPITQVAKESISSASSSAAETASAIEDKVTSKPGTQSRKSSLALTLGKGSSSKALPVDATTTTDHAMPQRRNTQEEAAAVPLPVGDEGLSKEAAETAAKSAGPQENDGAKPTADEGNTSKSAEHVQPSATPQSWIGWLAGGDGRQAKASPTTKVEQPKDASPPTEQPAQEPSAPASVEATAQEGKDQKVVNEPTAKSTEQAPSIRALQRRSWLPLWNNALASQSAPVITSPPADSQGTGSGSAVLEDPSLKDKPPQGNPDAESSLPDAPLQGQNKSSAWVFWSRDKPAETRSLKDAPREGEMAVANTDSETQPRRASVELKSDARGTSLVANAAGKAETVKDGKRVKNKIKESRASKLSEVETTAETTKIESKGATATAIAPAEAKASRTASLAPPKKSSELLLLPSLQQTLKIPENPSLFQQLTRLFYSAKDPDLIHLNLVKDPPRIKSALAIGVHGYFPAPLIQSVLGRPTGTSIKFADMAAKSIRRYTKNHGYECQVKTAALEGEGKIAERIDLLWKLLLNWIDEIRKADFVMIACHSQGVPVATILVAKLIHFGCIASTARVGICAMAGVSMGPFPEYKSRWISGSASELFEFSDPASKVSTDYLAALDDVLRFGVRLTYVGSIDDQLVSLESSIFAPVSHPHIYRAVSIDSRVHAPNFVSHLVAFALKLRNLGVQDHGLIKELSAPLAGSLYGGEGHSRLYEDDAIYDLAVAFALETTSMPGVPLTKRDIASSGNNPYILPFAMRGILEEDFVKSDLQDEASLLLQQFDDWKPTTKALKDVKFRLEGIRSKM
ncbi:hypothetical protein OHC33_006954 [Knufia fluminis]|uniref:YMC020W-like alpha/beta hydrolase domain-containing protein n=1 Tax=Knufia fluminis TaxID=191047 RepID=A0AAN8I2W6_9EURO|nr:hypothetical protein OHC33_006954 [Knufia fluminis]